MTSPASPLATKAGRENKDSLEATFETTTMLFLFRDFTSKASSVSFLHVRVIDTLHRHRLLLLHTTTKGAHPLPPPYLHTTELPYSFPSTPRSTPAPMRMSPKTTKLALIICGDKIHGPLTAEARRRNNSSPRSDENQTNLKRDKHRQEEGDSLNHDSEEPRGRHT
jgi:hypothetical protein